MAPTHTKKRTPLRARSRPTPAASTPSVTTAPTANATPSAKSKKDLKRAAKHSTLLTRVADSSRVGKTQPKRRRAGKNLGAVDSFAGMADALADARPEAAEAEEDGWEGCSDTEERVVPAGLRTARRRRKAESGLGAVGKMEMQSLPHKPGAAKKRRAADLGERERFGRNLAQMVGAGGGGGDGGDDGGGDASVAASQKRRWEGLRTFIEQTRTESEGFGSR
ncbi:hypothetical protein LTR08_003667 [Meristemomyces frigidus]|nr:hypothetical protein LTR08_003667 [Meristemomyces frigidus]